MTYYPQNEREEQMAYDIERAAIAKAKEQEALASAPSAPPQGDVEVMADIVVKDGRVEVRPPSAPQPTTTCKVRAAGLTDPPQDCDWPFCGCDPHADKVIAHLQECDMLRPIELEAQRAVAKKPFKLDVTQEWCERMANMEAEYGGDITAGGEPSQGQERTALISKLRCVHPVEQRCGGNDYIECHVCGVMWDYRKETVEQALMRRAADALEALSSSAPVERPRIREGMVFSEHLIVVPPTEDR